MWTLSAAPSTIDAMQVSINMIDGRLVEGRDLVAAAAEVLMLLLPAAAVDVLLLLPAPLSFAFFASRSSCCFFS